MRTFEVVLILVNVLSLLLGFKKQSQRIWLAAAGINLTVFLIHAFLEGLRYQLAFSYVFVILLVLVALLKTNRRLFETRTPKALKVATIGFSFVFLVVTAFLAYALPVFTLAKPTGPYAVGIKYFHFIDENRADPFLDKSTQKRELMVKIYYPAQKDDSKPYSAYFQNSPGLLRLMTTGYSLPGFMFDHLSLVKTHSKEALPISDEQQSYPVVLFSHGAGTTMEVQTSNCEDLASHGYMVVAIDHTFVSAATVFPDKVVSAREATTDFKTVEPAAIITQIMADDSKFVMDELAEMNAGQIDPAFKGKLNLAQIGVIGHSVGGAVAYNLAINDLRIKAAIDLDGTVFITPGTGLKTMAPFLMLANDKFHIQAIQNRQNLMQKFEDMSAVEQEQILSIYGSKDVYLGAYNIAQQNILALADVLKASGNLFTITGSDHMKFIDIGLFIGVSQLRELISIAGKTDPAKCLEITEAVTLVFFNQHLKGDNQVSWESLLNKYPELKKVDLH